MIQRRIAISLPAYARGINVADPNTLTLPQFGEYFRMAVADDLTYVISNANKTYRTDKVNEWKTLRRTIFDEKTTMAARVVATNTLVASINAYFDNEFADSVEWDAEGNVVPKEVIATPNRETRYAQNPEKTWSLASSEYVHTTAVSNLPQPITWDDDAEMWQRFGTGLGPLALQTVNPRGPLSVTSDNVVFEVRKPLLRLPWAAAKRLLPRPLLNLIFDVRYQLETGGTTVIDERPQNELDSKKATSKIPGTLRSWHSDAPKLLPGNNFDPSNVPEGALALHDHYTAHSIGGTGASQKDENAEGPVGYAEYTGTGSDWEHNTKVVLDYINKRVYLTLTHYQYWALITKPGGSFEFWTSGTQELTQAEERLTKRLTGSNDTATMMSPWLEIVMP